MGEGDLRQKLRQGIEPTDWVKDPCGANIDICFC